MNRPELDNTFTGYHAPLFRRCNISMRDRFSVERYPTEIDPNVWRRLTRRLIANLFRPFVAIYDDL